MFFYILYKHMGFHYTVVPYLHFSGFREKEIGNEKLIGVIDLQKMSYKNIDARGLITGFQILQVHPLLIDGLYL